MIAEGSRDRDSYVIMPIAACKEGVGAELMHSKSLGLIPLANQVAERDRDRRFEKKGQADSHGSHLTGLLQFLIVV